jgi:AMP deaminase
MQSPLAHALENQDVLKASSTILQDGPYEADVSYENGMHSLHLSGVSTPAEEQELQHPPRPPLTSSSRLAASADHPKYAASPAEAAAALASMGTGSHFQLDHGASSQKSDTKQIPPEELTPELRRLYSNLQRCLELRDKYLGVSMQSSWEDNPKNWDAEYCEAKAPSSSATKVPIKVDGSSLAEDGKTAKPWRIYPAPPRPHWEHFEPAPSSSFVVRPTSVNPLPPAIAPASPANAKAAQALLEAAGGKPGVFSMDHVVIPGQHKMKGEDVTSAMDDSGVFQVFAQDKDNAACEPLIKVPSIREYFKDLDYLLSVISDGPTKSFAWRRLKYLDGKWNLYFLLNEYKELADMKTVPHRDFYNVRKVDTHVHHSASMNQKHLLRFIKAKIKRYPDDVVIFRDGAHLTLQQVFESLNLTAYDLSIDTLDMHAHQDAFHRFDKFNLKYNPMGESRLREIFLKTDNYIKGRYLAEITRELINDLEQSKYQFAEYRISIYGRDPKEWDKLASWVVDNNLFSNNVRWLIQVPRLYDVYKANGTVDNFEQVIQSECCILRC